MATTIRIITLALAIVSLSLLAGACRTSWNVDELIDNTLSGRQGQIRTDLRDDLSVSDKASIAGYLATLETICAEMRGLVAKGDELQTTTRRPRAEVAGEQSDLVPLLRALSTRLAALEAPDQLAAAHSALVDAYQEYAAASAACVEAFAKLDFGALRQAGAGYESAVAAVLAAHDLLEEDVSRLLSPGIRLQIPRPR